LVSGVEKGWMLCSGTKAGPRRLSDGAASVLGDEAQISRRRLGVSILQPNERAQH